MIMFYLVWIVQKKSIGMVTNIHDYSYSRSGFLNSQSFRKGGKIISFNNSSQ